MCYIFLLLYATDVLTTSVFSMKGTQENILKDIETMKRDLSKKCQHEECERKSRFYWNFVILVNVYKFVIETHTKLEEGKLSSVHRPIL